MTRYLLVLLPLFVCADFAHGATLPPPLEAAVKDAETRKATAEKAGVEFTFSVHTVTSEDEFRLRYDPAATEAWTLESPETDKSAKLMERMARRDEERTEDAEAPDRRLIIGDLRELFGDRIELTANGPDGRVYRFNLSDKAKIGGGGGGQNFDVSEYLTGELAIDADNRLRWLRFFAEEAFKPVFVAKIESFDLKMFVDTVWLDGPYVIVRQVMDMNGSAFFKSFSENVKTVYGDFEKR